MLYAMDQEQLAFMMFPLGNLLKSEVREIAAALDLEAFKRRLESVAEDPATR